MSDKLDLDEIEALANAATPGPWHAIGNLAPWVESHAGHYVARPECDEDTAFIAAARTAVPALIAEVRALRELVEAAMEFRVDDYIVVRGERGWHVENYFTCESMKARFDTAQEAIAYARKMAEVDR